MIYYRFYIAGQWLVHVYFNINNSQLGFLEEALIHIGCSKSNAINTCNELLKANSGLTYTNPAIKTSIVCISNSTSSEQLVNTVVHEAKHLQSHICEEYNVSEDGEQAAYLIGYIVQKMYRIICSSADSKIV